MLIYWYVKKNIREQKNYGLFIIIALYVYGYYSSLCMGEKINNKINKWIILS